jgi:plastocyanin
MRHLVLPSLIAVTLGSLMAASCKSSSSPSTATSGTPTTTTTKTGTGTGGAGGAANGGGGQGGGGGHTTTTTGKGGGGGGEGGNGGTGGGAGGGIDEDAGTDCTVPAFCPGKDEPCRFRTCVGGKCGMTNAGAGTPAGQPKIGTCQQEICDGNGGVTTVADDNNLPNDGNPCTLDVCTNGVPTNPFVPKGTICNSLGTPRYCDDKGVCIECNADADCNGGTCTGGQCQGAAPCNDSKQNGNESDVDCGGGICPACQDGLHCKGNSDCMSKICTSGTCVPPPPTCDDGKKNQDETDVDCGGTHCGPCDAMKQCVLDTDCKSDFCIGGQTKHCIDKVVVNGCDITKAENHIGENKVSISFGGGVGNTYQPACILVTPGTQVAFNGDFSMHPLQGGTVANGVGTPDPKSIIQLVNSGFTKLYVASLATNYGYYCTSHVASGMMGAMFVVP